MKAQWIIWNFTAIKRERVSLSLSVSNVEPTQRWPLQISLLGTHLPSSPVILFIAPHFPSLTHIKALFREEIFEREKLKRESFELCKCKRKSVAFVVLEGVVVSCYIFIEKVTEFWFWFLTRNLFLTLSSPALLFSKMKVSISMKSISWMVIKQNKSLAFESTLRYGERDRHHHKLSGFSLFLHLSLSKLDLSLWLNNHQFFFFFHM